jgi:MFS family permease
VFIGIGLAAAVSAGVATLPQEELMSWGWRVPFLFSIVVVAIGLLIRLRVPESPVFTELKEARARTRVPALTLIRAMPKRLLLVMVANGVLAFNIYVVQTYSLSYIANKGVPKSAALVAVLVGCAVGAAAIPVVAMISDRTGRKPVYIGVSAFCALIAFPFFWLLDTSNVALIIVAFALALGGCLAMFGSQAAYYSELFPAAFRFSGFALGREIPGAVLAGPAPVISVGLVSLADGSPTLLAVAMIVVAVAGLFAVVALPETRGIDLAPIVDPDGPDSPQPPVRTSTPESRPIALS